MTTVQVEAVPAFVTGVRDRAKQFFGQLLNFTCSCQHPKITKKIVCISVLNEKKEFIEMKCLKPGVF